MTSIEMPFENQRLGILGFVPPRTDTVVERSMRH